MEAVTNKKRRQSQPFLKGKTYAVAGSVCGAEVAGRRAARGPRAEGRFGSSGGAALTAGILRGERPAGAPRGPRAASAPLAAFRGWEPRDSRRAGRGEGRGGAGAPPARQPAGPGPAPAAPTCRAESSAARPLCSLCLRAPERPAGKVAPDRAPGAAPGLTSCLRFRFCQLSVFSCSPECPRPSPFRKCM